ncbi:MAG TPA: hypothetical protein VK631_22080, partial [Solirubrobacteraceae bacterium]|nr:hypothetical protein [Solirubrobacteraceae bacterium]
MDDRLNIDALENLAMQFRRAADRDLRHAARRRRVWRSKPLVLLVALALSGSAVAGTLVVTEGDPLPSASVQDFRADQLPLAGTSRLAGVQVSDPEGGLPWGLRVAEGRMGGKCFTPGRVYDGKLGVQQGSTFRSIPELGPQQCA